jgi:hypothetical protein
VRQRQAQREHQRITDAADPVAAQAASALGLLLGNQQHRVRQPVARAAHEFGIWESMVGSTSTVKPGNCGAMASHKASAFQ